MIAGIVVVTFKMIFSKVGDIIKYFYKFKPAEPIIIQ